MLVGKVVPRKITKEFTFVNRTGVSNLLCQTLSNALLSIMKITHVFLLVASIGLVINSS